MRRRKWLLLILAFLLLAGWWKLFYKTWNNQTVPAAADCIIAADIKAITNRLAWDFITTPSRWKEQNIFSSSHDDRVSWDDMISLPDYVFVFHLKNQPLDYWHCVLPIDDQDDFRKGLQQYHFENKGDSCYFSNNNHLSLKIIGSKVLISILPQYEKGIVSEAFTQLNSTHAPEEIIKRNISQDAHVAVQYITGKDYYVGSIDFNWDNIFIRTSWEKPNSIFLQPALMNSFRYNSQSLCTVAFTQNPALTYYLSDSAKKRITGLLNFEVDSLLQPDNWNYQLDVQGFTQRTDTAITYSYDDNFNPIEQKEINKVEEPAYRFIMRGLGVKRTFDYWKRNQLLEEKPNGLLFTPFPFAKSYCGLPAADSCSISTVDYQANNSPDKTRDAALFIRIVLSKLPASIMRYLPDEVQKSISNIDWLEIEGLRNKKTGSAIEIKATIHKKKNLRPIIEW